MRGILIVAAAAASASSRTSPGVQNGSSAAAKVTVPAASAAGISWRSSGIAAAAGLGATVAWRGRADFDRSRLGEVRAVRRASASCSADGRRDGSIVSAEETASAIAGGTSGRAVPIGFAPASIAAAT